MKKKGKPLNISQKVKFRKTSKSITNLSYNHLTFKHTRSKKVRYVVQAGSNGKLSPAQVEALRVSFRRPIKHIRLSRVIPSQKPRLIVTKRSFGIRMGRGKGGPAAQVSLVQKGQLLYEVIGPTPTRMFNVFMKCRKKLPVRMTLVDLRHGKVA